LDPFAPTAPVAGRQEGALAQYLRAIRAHPFVIAGITLLTIAVAVAWVTRKEPVYKATAEVLVTPMPADSNALFGIQLLRESNDPTRTLQTAASLVETTRAAELTARRMGDGYTRTSVQEQVEVEPQGQSNILAVTAEANDADESARLANTFIDSSLQARRETLRRQIATVTTALEGDIQTDPTTPAPEGSAAAETRAELAQLRRIANGGDPTLSIAQRAIAPTGKTGPPAPLVIIIAAIAGLALSAGAALLMEATNRRVRDVDELLSILPLPVLARIPKLSSRDSGGALALPPAAREAYRTLQVQLDQDAGKPRVIMLTSANSQDGKTNAAVHLGLALVAAGSRVILIDFDLRKPDIARLMRLPETGGLVSLVSGRHRLEEVLVPAPQLPPLRVAPAGTGEGDALLLSALTRRLGDILGEARELADYVILDTAPLGEVSDALRLVPHVDDVIIVARPNNTQRQDLEAMRELLARAGVEPAGLIVVGASGSRPSRYHTYGTPTRPRAGRRALSRSGG
jgi:capsular exopolysaccharide synthesis family protein